MGRPLLGPEKPAVRVDDAPLRHLAKPAERVTIIQRNIFQRANRLGTHLLKNIVGLYLRTQRGPELPFDVAQQRRSPCFDELRQRLPITLP